MVAICDVDKKHLDDVAGVIKKRRGNDVEKYTDFREICKRKDIDAFMNGYRRSEETVFVSGDEVTRGWQKVLDRYKKKYSDRAKMGTLTFSNLEITPLSNDSAVVLGSWELKRANDNPHGRFTLIFRRFPDGWKIVHDHTSAAENKSLKKAGTQE